MNYEKEIAHLENKIKQDKNKLAELKGLRNEERKVEARKNRKPAGRKPLPTELLERARKTARTKTMTDTALSLGVCLTSLYNHGISRKSIDAEISLESDLQKKGKSS
jgi:hypothetical protein